MKDRAVLSVIIALQFIRNQWARLVEEFVVREPIVKIGDMAINPEHGWVVVRNQPGIKNANGFHRFGEYAGIPEGGRLTALAVDGNKVLVSFENSKGQRAGAIAGNGTLFFVSTAEFVSMTPRYDQGLMERADEKIQVLVLLRRSLELELLNHRRTAKM